MSVYVIGDCHGDIDLKKMVGKERKRKNLNIT